MGPIVWRISQGKSKFRVVLTISLLFSHLAVTETKNDFYLFIKLELEEKL